MASIWEQFEHDPRQRVHAELRAADADRDVARRALTEAYAEGRLEPDELDERTDRVLAARTLGDLPVLLEDLVPAVEASTTPATRHDAAVRAYRKDRKDALWQFLSITVLCWVIWVVTSLGPDGFNPYFPWPAFPTVALGINLGRVLFMREELIEQEERRLEKKERKALEKARIKKLPPPPGGNS